MIIIGCSNSKKLAKKLAKKINFPYQDLALENFPNGEIHLKFETNLKNETVILVQTFYPHPNNSLLEVLFASSVARDLEAKKVILIAPYLAYLKEDVRSTQGECIGNKIISDLLNKNFDAIITVHPHLHSEKIFSIPIHKIDISDLLKHYIKKNFKDPLIIAPDQYISNLAKKLSFNSITLNKKRKDFFNVAISGKIPDSQKEKEVLIVDDIISTASTMIEAIKFLKTENATCLTIHPAMIGGALSELEKHAKKIISTNTIQNQTNRIDITNLIAKKILEI